MTRCPKCGATWAPDHKFCPHDGALLEKREDGGSGVTRKKTRKMPRLGDVLDEKYRLDEVIGTGGMGVVFKAFHQRIGRNVAIKVLRSEVVGDRTQLRRFVDEARLAGSIGHDGIVEIYDLVTPEQGSPYIVMELLEGISLSGYLKKKKTLSARRALEITLGILEALDAAHARDIVHRDVKPGNIFLARKQGRGEVIKLLDFGIARARRENIRLTTPGRAVGTAVYMPPEQIMASEVDSRADIYAAAAVLYLMLTGLPPFAGRSWPELAKAKLSTSIPPIKRFRTSQAHLLERVIKMGLERDPGDRPASAMDYHRAISETLESVSAADGARASQIPTMKLHRKRRIAVLPFTVEPAGHPEAWLGEALAISLFDDLTTRRGQKLVALNQCCNAQACLEGALSSSPASIGREIGAGYVITGKLTFQRDDLHLETSVVEVESGEVGGHLTRTGDKTSIFRLLDATLQAFGKVIELTPPGEWRRIPLHEIDFDAYRSYIDIVRGLLGRSSEGVADSTPNTLNSLLEQYPGHLGLRRALARIRFQECLHGASRDQLNDLSAELDTLSSGGCSDPWIPIGRAALRHSNRLFNPVESAVLAEEQRVMQGFDARVLLEEASALENAGQIGDAKLALSMIIEQDRACVPALLRLALLELSPMTPPDAALQVPEKSLEKAGFLIRSVSRLLEEEKTEAERAICWRRGWSPIADLTPFEAMLAVRRGEPEHAQELLHEQARTSDPLGVLLALTVSELISDEPRLDPLLEAFGAHSGSFETPSNHVVTEAVLAAPEVWSPVLSAWLNDHARDHRTRLISAYLESRLGNLEQARAAAELVSIDAPNEEMRQVATRFIRVIQS